MRALRVTLLVLAATAAAAAWTERSPWFAPVRAAMRSDSVPRAVLEDGALGRGLAGLELVHPAHLPHEERWRGRRPRGVYRLGRPTPPPPNSVPAATPHLVDAWPLISVTVNDEDLNDPSRGLYPNWQESFEVRGHMAYFEGHSLVASAPCGVRLHGDSTRRPEARARHGPGLRLSFREPYGRSDEDLGLALWDEPTPLERLVIRGDSPLYCSLAFDISRQVGAGAPAMHPALFVLNGELLGLRSVTEHLSRRTWRARLGHDDFYFYRPRSRPEPVDYRAHEALRRWALGLSAAEVTMDRIKGRVDLDNLERHLFTILWCGTDDWAQGAAVCDLRAEEPRWSWVHWDMDRSFRPSVKSAAGETWRKPALELLLGQGTVDAEAHPNLALEQAGQRDSVRGILFRSLVRDDPEFRRRFTELACELMNHELAMPFLRERLTYYHDFRAPGGLAAETFQRVVDFALRRSSFVREDLARVFELPAAVPCQVSLPEGLTALIDGRPWSTSYRGWYFPGQHLTLRVAPESALQPGGWLVQRERLLDQELDLTVDGPLEIHPILE